MLQIKETKKLFYGKYQYKIVLVCRGAYLFRLKDLDKIYDRLSNLTIETEPKSQYGYYRQVRVDTKEEYKYCVDLYTTLSLINNFSLRVEQPLITVYSNNKEDIDKLSDLDPLKVKYISIPLITLEENVIVMNDTPYEFRVTVGKGVQDLTSFVEWANNSRNIKMAQGCKDGLSRKNRHTHNYFYVNGEKNLLMVKMQIGRDINRIEKIINRSKVNL